MTYEKPEFIEANISNISDNHSKLVSLIEFKIITENLKLDSSKIPEILSEFPRSKDIPKSKGICISGMMPVWLGTSLVSHYKDHIFVSTYDPRLDACIVGFSNKPENIPIGMTIKDIYKKSEKKKTKNIAVYGDPNTGKSVIAYLLARYAPSEGISAFRENADPAAPTSSWFLESECQDITSEIRKKVKGSFTMEKACGVKDNLKNIKENGIFDVVFADLGGGNPPNRLTKELQEISEEIDNAIILCPKENYKNCVDGWKSDLEKKAKKPIRIIRECTSDLNGKTEVNENTCIISGLDRKFALNPKKETVMGIKSLLKDIKKVL